MILILKVKFWLLIFLVLYIYIGYPLFLYFLSLFSRKKLIKSDFEPSVSLIIFSSNDDKKLMQKIENCLLLEYPRNKLEIIVASCGTSENMSEVVSNYYKRGIKLFYQAEKKNENEILNNCILQTKGEIISFTDDNSVLDKYSLKNLVRNFADSKVGLVCGNLRYNVNDNLFVQGENLFLKYKKLILNLSSKIKVLTLVNKELYAIRKSLFKEMKELNIPACIVLPLSVLKERFKTVYEPLAIVNKDVSFDFGENFKIELNRIMSELSSIKYLFDLIRSFRLLMFIQLLSYNILLNLAGVLFISIFIINFLILVKPLYVIMFLLQIIFYMAGLLRISYIPFYFSFINLVSLMAVVKMIFRKDKHYEKK
ncbi:MAG: glycosyltransferase [Candidatus Firestonebacteria bacterium]